MLRLNRENVLSYFLAFVALWFGYNEVTAPSDWVGLVPEFLGSGNALVYLVFTHGVVLILCAMALVFNFHRRAAAGVLGLVLLGIVGALVMKGGVSDVAVRDIGLFGMALALWLRG